MLTFFNAEVLQHLLERAQSGRESLQADVNIVAPSMLSDCFGRCFSSSQHRFVKIEHVLRMNGLF